MKKTATMTAMTAGLFMAALTSNAYANYVVDGDFSNPYGGVSFTTYFGGQSMGSWTVGGDSVDLIGGYWQSPSAGINKGSVDMNGNAPGSISQSLATTAGTYRLTFSLSANPDGGIATRGVDVSVGNVSNDAFNYTLTGANSRSNMNYITESLVFSTSGATNLVFASNVPSGPFGAAIGNVSVNRVSAVPLPAGLPMFASALLGMFGLHMLRRRQQQPA